MENGKIYIPKNLDIVQKAFCDLINIALEEHPNITLKEFASILDKTNREDELNEIVSKQMQAIQADLRR